MNPSCLFKSFLLAATAAGPLFADILPPDSHLVPRSAILANTGDYPGRIFLALEFYPGNPGTPVAATLMDRDAETKLYGYKLDWIALYSAPAADWPAIRARLGGILKNPPATSNQAAPPCAAPADASAPCLCCHTDPSPASDWKTGLTSVPGRIDAAPSYADNSSILRSETLEYSLAGNGPDTVVATARLQFFSDGTKKEIPIAATALRQGAGALSPRLGADGRSLVWVPGHNGIVTLSLYDERGRRAWSVRKAASAGVAQSLVLPPLAQGRYLLSEQGRGRKQTAWVDLGKR